MVGAFSAAAEREWVSFVKAMQAVWPSVHLQVKAQAEARLAPLLARVKLTPLAIARVNQHPLVQDFRQEQPPADFSSARWPYSPGCFLAQHLEFLLKNVQGVRALVEAKLRDFMSQPRVAETVQQPVLSEHFVKTRNSILSKVAREHLRPEDDAQVKAKVFLRDVFRLRL